MNILCLNTDDAVWEHWCKTIDANVTLVRTTTMPELRRIIESEFKSTICYCFVYLGDEAFSQQVEDVVALRGTYSHLKVIVFPNQSSQSAALRLFSAGVNGQCAPYIGQQQLSLVLSVVESGEIWGGKVFIQQLIQQSAVTSSSFESELEGLSERELAVAHFIAKGFSNKQIATEMKITERTVKAHLTSVFKKTNTKDRLSLALLVQAH